LGRKLALRLQFDPNQPYQLDAIQAVTDLFDGQPRIETKLRFNEDPGQLDVFRLPPYAP